MKTRAAAAFWAALMLALVVFTGAAAAGGHDHGGGDGHGSKPSQHDDSNGVKPSSSTQHDTEAQASSDKTKEYGNGQTAGQVATKNGYGNATLHGPGNSQPHKVNCGGHEVDVHALKHKKCGEVKGAKHEENHPAPAPQPAKVMVSFCDMESPTSGKLETKDAAEVIKHELNGTPEEARDIVPPFTYNGHTYSQIWTDANQAIFKNGCNAAAPPAPVVKPAEHKVTICHKTGSATNPYVEITVDEHALKHGHTAAKGDIIPAPAGGCPTAAPQPATVSVSFCDMESPTSGKLETKDAAEVIKHELNGTPEEARDIVPPFTYNGQSYSQIWTDANQAIFKNGCQAPAVAQVQGTTQGCTTTKTVSEQVVVGVKHFIGPKGSGRFVIIHPSPNSSHYRDKHPDELVYQTVTKTVTVPADCPSQSTTTTTTQQTTTEQQTITTTVAAVASAPSSTPPAAGAVLGAVAPLHTAKPASSAQGGVLGTIAPLGRSVAAATLPFTGLPLWLFALVAIGLIAVGTLARRASAVH